jgi:hypothetical protein
MAIRARFIGVFPSFLSHEWPRDQEERNPAHSMREGRLTGNLTGKIPGA